MDYHRTFEDAKLWQKALITYEILDNLNVNLDWHFLVVIDVFSSWFVEINIFAMIFQRHGCLGVIKLEHERVEVFLLDVVILLISNVNARDYGDNLWNFKNIDAVGLLLYLE